MHKGYKQDKGLEQDLTLVFGSPKAVGTVIMDTVTMQWYPSEFEGHGIDLGFLPNYSIFPTTAGARVTVMHIGGCNV